MKNKTQKQKKQIQKSNRSKHIPFKVLTVTGLIVTLGFGAAYFARADVRNWADNKFNISHPEASEVTVANNALAEALAEKLLIQTQLDTANATVTSLQTQLVTANANITAIQAQLDAANANVTSLQAQLDTVNATVVSLQAQLVTANTTTTNIQSQLDIANATVVSLQTQLATTNTNTIAIQTQLDTANENVTSLQTQLTASNENATSLQVQLDTANASITSLQTQLDTANENVTSLQTQLTASNENAISLQVQLDTASASIISLQTQLDAANAIIVFYQSTTIIAYDSNTTVLSWASVGEDINYNLTITDEGGNVITHPLSDTSYLLSSDSLSVGTYNVSLKAISNDNDVLIATKLVIISAQLESPQASIDLMNKTISWNNVANASGYFASMTTTTGTSETVSLDPETTTLDLSSYSVDNGTIIQVYAVGDGVHYIDSNGSSYTVNFSQLLAPVISLSGHTLTISNFDDAIINRTDSYAGYVSLRLEYPYTCEFIAPVTNGAVVIDLTEKLSLAEYLTPDAINAISVQVKGFDYYTQSESSNSINYVYDWYESETQLSAPIISYDENTQIFTMISNNEEIPFETFSVYYSIDGIDFQYMGGFGGCLSSRIEKDIPSGTYYFKATSTCNDVSYTESEFSNVVSGDYTVVALDTPVLSYDENNQTLNWATQIINGTEQNYSLQVLNAVTGSWVWTNSFVGGSVNVNDLGLEAGTYDFSMTAYTSENAYGFIKSVESETITLALFE